MDIIAITSVAVSLLGFILSVLAQKAALSEKTARYADILKQVERLLTGKPISTHPLDVQLDNAVRQLTEASERVGDILGEIQAEVDRKRREADRLRSAIEQLRKEYAENQSLANLSAEEANAVRQLLTKEVSVLKRRSYLPDILINFGVGAFFFVLGIAVTRLLGQ